jgi:hypothetical protein
MVLTRVIATIPAGQLPLQPELTPAWGIAGAILIITGVVYTLIGIKNTWLHVFLSTGYLASLGIAVLVLYVMALPVSHAIQGAYLVGVVCPGLVFGGLAIVFKEITEGLGCLLGGFCVAMWLLCAHAGGLLSGLGAKVGFITAFMTVVFGLSFSRFTRHYALMGSIAFTGATATVLGIDCFTRAGLKEFWAYVWNLNGDLFPLGTTTYPLTRGIKVEIAAIVIICALGLVSQFRLWRFVKERRAKRAEALARERHERDMEEARRGQILEAGVRRERVRWERAYADRILRHPVGPENDESSDGDKEKEERVEGPKEKDETVDVSAEQNSLSLGKKTPALEADDKVWIVGGDGEARLSPDHPSTSESKKLPDDRVVVSEPDDLAETDGEQSCCATAADEDEDAEPMSARRNHLRASMTGGLPTPSEQTPKSPSRQSKRSSNPRSTHDDEQDEPCDVPEGYVTETESVGKDDESLIATVDDMSTTSSSNTHNTGNNPELETTPTMAAAAPHMLLSLQQIPPAATASLNTSTRDDAVDTTSKPDSSPIIVKPEKAAGTDVETPDGTAPYAGPPMPSLSELKSMRSSKRGSLVSSYRTSEWAKQLIQAENPELDSRADMVDVPLDDEEEDAAPVHIESLQQTAANATPAPAAAAAALRRESSTGSRRPSASRYNVIRSSTPSQNPVATSTPPANPVHITYTAKKGPGPIRRVSREITVHPIPEEISASPTPISTITESPAELSSSSASIKSSTTSCTTQSARPPVPGIISHTRPQSFLGQQDMMRREWSHGTFAAIPEPGPYYPSRSTSPTVSVYDGLPFTQRKQLTRQSSDRSRLSMQSQQSALRRASGPYVSQARNAEVAGSTYTQRPEPKDRRRSLPSQVVPREARAAQLASFRNSVAEDLRNGPAVHPQLSHSNSTDAWRDEGVMRNIEHSRSMMMLQREQEAQKREAERWEREAYARNFDERMRRGELMNAHREALRRLQGRAS